MGSVFDSLMVAADVAIDGVFAESVLITPLARVAGDPNARTEPDPDRWSLTLQAVWSEPPSKLTRPANRTGVPDAQSMRFTDDKPAIDFPTATLPFELRVGDLVTRLATGEVLAVAGPLKGGFTRTSASLTGRKGHT